jgi:flavin-dependent dehydrogenase
MYRKEQLKSMTTTRHHGDAFQIAGAGLAGLTAAIGLARQGYEVEVFDKNTDSGQNRQTDWDIVENWTTDDDFCGLLTQWCIQPDFDSRGGQRIDIYDQKDNCYSLVASRAMYYLVRRGSQPKSIEQSLKRQAIDLGVNIHYGQPQKLADVDIWATGLQRNGFFLEVGMTFRTNHVDAMLWLTSIHSAPRTNAYMIIVEGHGKVMTVITQDFANARVQLNQAIDAFKRITPFDMEDMQIISGFGGLPYALNQTADHPIRAGEAAGFQDFLWGFGIRHALLSGKLSAQAVCNGQDYQKLVADEIHPLVHSSLSNRMLYDMGGEHFYKSMLRWVTSATDMPGALGKWVRGQKLQSILWPIAQKKYQSKMVYDEFDE